MITSGIGLEWKRITATDLITQQLATTSDLHFSKPRWTFRDQSPPPSHFLELPDELSALCNYGRKAHSYMHHTQGHTLLTRLQLMEWWLHFHRTDSKRTKRCLSLLSLLICPHNFWWESFFPIFAHPLQSKEEKKKGSREISWRFSFRRRQSTGFLCVEQIIIHSETILCYVSW